MMEKRSIKRYFTDHSCRTDGSFCRSIRRWKTTLANLISRFFDPQSGMVKIGGVNVKDIPKEELMNTVSFVFQNSRLIKASILENVRMGNRKLPVRKF